VKYPALTPFVVRKEKFGEVILLVNRINRKNRREKAEKTNMCFVKVDETRVILVRYLTFKM